MRLFYCEEKLSQKNSVLGDETVGNVIYVREGDSIKFAIPISGASTVTSSSLLFYKEGSTSEVSSTYFTGSMSESGTTIVTKTTQNLKQGRWVMSIWATVDGYVQNVRTYPFIVKRKSEL